MASGLKISLNQSPKKLNELLIKEYGYSLFCFSLAYANIFINKTFLTKSFFPDSQRLQRENDKLINLKKRAQKVLTEYFSFKFQINKNKIYPLSNWDELSGFAEFIDKEINSNKVLLSSEIFKTLKRGPKISLETKIAFIFSLVMTKKIPIDIKQEKKLKKKYENTLTAISKCETDELFDKKFNDFLFEIFIKIEMKKLKPNYEDIFDLMDWLNYKTSYLSQLNIEYRAQLQDRIRKIYESRNFYSYLAGTVLLDLFWFIAQNYFDETNIAIPVEIFVQGIPIRKAFPTFFIKFAKGFVELGEIIEDNSVYKKYLLNSKIKKPSITKASIKHEIISNIVFLNGKPLPFKSKEEKKLPAILSKYLFFKKKL